MNFIHPKAEVDSKAVLGDNSSVWAFAVLRADEGNITVGDNTSIQEHCLLHGDLGKDVVVGNNVTIGHGAIVHGAQVGDNVLVGMHATILTGAEIGEWSIIAAGAVVREGEKIPANSLVAGVPGKVVRQLTGEDRKRIVEAAENYVNKLRRMEQTK